jgi:hypothetical protein
MPTNRERSRRALPWTGPNAVIFGLISTRNTEIDFVGPLLVPCLVDALPRGRFAR